MNPLAQIGPAGEQAPDEQAIVEQAIVEQAIVEQAMDEQAFIERRHAVRVPTDDSACLKVLYPASPDRFVVRVLDVSKGGFKLHSDQFLQRGTTVQVRLKESIAQCDVRYCVPARDRSSRTGFYVGVEIQQVFAIPHGTKPEPCASAGPVIK